MQSDTIVTQGALPRLRSSAPGPVSDRLVAIDGPVRGLVYPLAQKVVNLGRADTNEIVLPDGRVSRHHARLRREGRGWLIEDLGSVNGTGVAGTPIHAPRRLGAGDRLQVGRSIFELQPADADDATSLEPARMSTTERVIGIALGLAAGLWGALPVLWGLARALP